MVEKAKQSCVSDLQFKKLMIIFLRYFVGIDDTLRVKIMIFKKIVVLCLSLAIGNLSYANKFEVPVSSLSVPNHLAITALMYSKEGFRVVQNNASKEVAAHNVDKTIRSVSSEQLEAFVKGGYISVNQLENGEFTLSAKVRGPGGGLATGVVVYEGVKIIGNAGIWLGVLGSTVAAFPGGPEASAAAYLAAMSLVPSATAAVEGAALSVGMAAALIPILP
jgi:hypothetical protein